MEAAKMETEEQYEEMKSKGIPINRDAMLRAIRQNQPSFMEAPVLPSFASYFDNAFLQYKEVLTGIGGHIYVVDNYKEIIRQLEDDFAGVKRIVSFDKRFSAIAELPDESKDPHELEDVDVCIVSSSLAVAENGAIWISDKEMPVPVLPFIAQSLVAVIHKTSIVSTMHDAYDIIGNTEYDFATFIAGPSKTADIEQSLVLGAHGPKSMLVFIINA